MALRPPPRRPDGGGPVGPGRRGAGRPGHRPRRNQGQPSRTVPTGNGGHRRPPSARDRYPTPPRPAMLPAPQATAGPRSRVGPRLGRRPIPLVEPVRGGEHLPPPGVDDGGHPLRTVDRTPCGGGGRQHVRLLTPRTPTDRAWARALAVATPTRSPVNRPGPTSTATPSMSATRQPDAPHTSLWTAPEARHGPRRPHAPWPPRRRRRARGPHPPCWWPSRWPAGSPARLPRNQGPDQRRPPVRPGVTGRPHGDHPRVSTGPGSSCTVSAPRPKRGRAASPHSTRATPPSSTSSRGRGRPPRGGGPDGRRRRARRNGARTGPPPGTAGPG